MKGSVRIEMETGDVLEFRADDLDVSVSPHWRQLGDEPDSLLLELRATGHDEVPSHCQEGWSWHARIVHRYAARLSGWVAARQARKTRGRESGRPN